MNIVIKPLTKAIARDYLDELIELLTLIPASTITPEGLFHHSMDLSRVVLAKWKHDLIMFDEDTPIGVLLAYERPAEENDQYPYPTLYLGQLAIALSYQRKGLGTRLVKTFLKRSNRFLEVEGDFNISVQTNSSAANQGVQSFYKQLGFIQRGEKQYCDRHDYIYELRNDQKLTESPIS